MTYLSACHELDDLGGGHFRNITYLRPVAYLDGGVYKYNILDWVDDGGGRLATQVSSRVTEALCPTASDTLEDSDVAEHTMKIMGTK